MAVLLTGCYVYYAAGSFTVWYVVLRGTCTVGRGVFFFYNVEFLLYRGRTVLYTLCIVHITQLYTLCIVHITQYARGNVRTVHSKPPDQQYRCPAIPHTTQWKIQPHSKHNTQLTVQPHPTVNKVKEPTTIRDTAQGDSNSEHRHHSDPHQQGDKQDRNTLAPRA